METNRAFKNRVLWMMADSDFSKVNPILSNFYALHKVFWLLFCDQKSNALFLQLNLILWDQLPLFQKTHFHHFFALGTQLFAPQSRSFGLPLGFWLLIKPGTTGIQQNTALLD